MAAAYAGPDCELRPDPAVMRAFREWWFKSATQGMIEIGWMKPSTGGLTEFAQFERDDIDTLVATATQVNLVPGQSVYIRAATVRAGSAPNTGDADFVQAPGIWSDIDKADDLARAKTVESIVRPNASVITGTVPTTRVQSWFLTTEPITSATVVRDLNVRLHRLYGGDPSVVNASRLMRLPGTIAWPYKELGVRVPELVQFILPEPNGTRPSSYPLATLISQLPKDDAKGAPKDEPFDFGIHGAGLSTVSRLIAAIKSGNHNWHDSMIKLVAHWVGLGRSSVEILGHCPDWTLSGYTVQQTRVEVARAIDDARKKWGVPDADPAVNAEPGKPFGEALYDPWGELTAPPFPIEALPGVLRAYVEGRARIMGADPCALAWAALSACSAALDGRTRLRMKLHDSSWMVPPSLWVALIGEPSTKKTPIFQETWAPLQALQNVAVRAYMERLAEWQRLPKAEREMVSPPPLPRRLISNDATIESLQNILSHQDRGVAMMFDELASFIGGMDRYSNNGRGGSDRAFFLRAYTGGSHIVDRVSRGIVSLNNLLITICGGIQPDRLAAFKDLMDDGLWQRLLPIITSAAGMGVDEEDRAATEEYTLRLQGMVDASNGHVASMSVGANAVRVEIEAELFRLERLRPIGPKFSSFLGKLPGVFGRLCLVLSYIEPKGMGYVVRRDTAEAARTLILDCVIPHAVAVYLAMGEVDGVPIDQIQSVAGYLLAKKKSRVVASDLASDVRACRGKTVFEIGKLVSPLVAGGWLLPETEAPACRAWTVNPAIYVRYAERAESERVRRQALVEMIKS
jgi:hypothetical protein